MQGIDLTGFGHAGANLTGVSFVKLKDIIGDNKAKIRKISSTNILKSSKLLFDQALIYDAFLLFKNGISLLHQSALEGNFNISCKGDQTWDHGISFNNYLKSVCIIFYIQ